LTEPPRLPVLDHVPGYPERQPLWKAWKRWWRDTWWYLRHTLTPTENYLPPPAKSIAPAAGGEPPTDLKERLAAAKAVVDAAEKRLDTVRGKATSLLGFVSLATPVLSWWLLSGRDRLAAAPLSLVWVVYGLMVLAAVSILLCLLALFRSYSVGTYPTQTPDLFVDLEKGELKPHDWAAELRGQAEAWGAVHRWADVVADFFKAGQRFLIVAVAAAVTAGTISYLYPQPNRPVTVVQRPSGELAVQGASAPTGPDDEAARWRAAFWNLLWLVVGVALGVGVTLLVARRNSGRPPKGPHHDEPVGVASGAPAPERRDIVQLTPAAAAKVREFLSVARPYLRVATKQIDGGPPAMTLDAEVRIDPESDYLDESEGIPIAVSRESVPHLTGRVIDWVETGDGRSGFSLGGHGG
jgi:Fe-S cluster assembly iron-binding protein IscA